MSVLNFPDRGPWGSNKYRGNASGHIYKSLYEQLKPREIVEVFSGSGTAEDVARELRIPIVSLDLKNGFDATRHSIIEHVGHESDLVFGHGPYLDIIRYSGKGNMWGTEAHPGDISHISDTDEFIDMMQAVLLNQREATRPGGIYGTLTGDVRRNGQYISLQAELIARLPREELRSIQIKTQHNTHSSRQSYGRMRFPFITHEYILLWQRPQNSGTYHVLASVTLQNDRRIKGTWRAILKHALTSLGGQADLQSIYRAVSEKAPEQRLEDNPNWQAKIRQVLQRHTDFTSSSRGHWSLT